MIDGLRIAGEDLVVLGPAHRLEDGVERRQLLGGEVCLHGLVAIDDGAIGQGDGHDLPLVAAGLPRRRGTSVGLEGETVQLGPFDSVGHREMIGRHPDRRPAELRCDLGVGVEAGLVGEEADVRHHLDATGQHQVGLTRGDGTHARRNRRDAADAVVVDGSGGARVRQAGFQFRHEGDVPALRTDLTDAAEVKRIGGIDGALGRTLSQCGHQLTDELVRPNGGQRTAGPTLRPRGPHRVVDVDARHRRDLRRTRRRSTQWWPSTRQC